jgi:hypothetical protein
MTRSFFDNKTMQCMRRLGDVPRWQIVPTLRTQSVQEHSVGVLMIAGRMALRHDINLTRTNIMTLLTHDDDEAIKGDVPSTAKTPKDPNDCEDVKHALLKFADYLESLAYLKEEMAMGNQRVRDVYHNVRDDAAVWGCRFLELVGYTSEIAHQMIPHELASILGVYDPTVIVGLTHRGDP